MDAFILFNEREEIVISIVHQLESAGVRTYLWRRDIPYGADWQQSELSKLVAAKVVLIFLGPLGWGSTHERLVDESLRLGKVIIPVLVGQPPDGALAQGRGIFQRLRYVEISPPADEETIARLANQIHSAPVPANRQFDALVSSFVDGDEGDRLISLQRVRSLSAHQRVQLAVRLRAELSGRFNRERSSDIATSVRDPNMISSIRSWLFSALICADAESDASRGLILDELQTPGTNPFWILSQLFEIKASYLNSAAESVASRPSESDDAVWLARVLLGTTEELLSDFRSRLISGSFKDAWPVLRVMRIVSLPDFVPVACDLFINSPAESPQAYDALYALCGNVNEAANFLTAEPGVESSVGRLIEIARLSNEVAKMNFTVLLAAFKADDVERALSSVERDPLNADVARKMRAYLRNYRQRAGTGLRALAGFNSDEINIKNDFLGFDRDVQTLTSVMISKAVTPPLAIGLFGDWGTGKSHFMRSMEEAVKNLRDRAEASESKTVCRNVVQIWFNAWHYVDTNLWASLVSHILEQLAAFVSPSKRPEEQRQELLKELVSAKDLLARAHEDRERVSKEASAREEDLKGLRTEREQKEVRLRDLQINDLRSLLESDPQAKKALEDSLATMGVPALLNSISDLSAALKQLQETRTRAGALLSALVNSKFKAVTYVLLVIALVGIPVTFWLLEHYVGISAAYTRISACITWITVMIGAIVPVIRNALSAVDSKIKAVQDAKERVERVIAAKRDAITKEEAQLQGEIAALSEKEKLAATRLEAASTRVTEIEQRINAINEESSLTRFLSDRTRTDDYRKHLGLTSIIRRDFEDLKDRLLKPGAGNKSVERVILYIDDLDRCAPVKVMEVLEAVHLLLAFDLFVVVVGVDPRWLLHALREEFTAFDSDGRISSPDAKHWQTTPQNYIEKIFQIPYCLPRMTADGFGKMIAYELGSAAEPGVAEASSGTTELATSRESLATVAQESAEANPRHDAPATEVLAQQLAARTELGTPQGNDDNVSFEVAPEALDVRPWERVFAQRLESLIATPRGIKRFANVYRMLKASVDPVRLLEYEGTAESPGEFQVPMTLLAMLIGEPTECVQLFPRLLAIANDGQDIIAFLDQDPSINRVCSKAMQAKLKPIIHDPAFPRSPEIYVRWLPDVAKYSFDVGKSLLWAHADSEKVARTPYEPSNESDSLVAEQLS